MKTIPPAGPAERARERSWTVLGEALSRSGRERSLRDQRPGSEPWPGDLFVLPETAGLPVEWLVIERGRGGRCLVLAADSNPLLGCADVTIPPDAEGEPMSVRCHAGLWLGVDSLRRGERSGVVSPASLAEVRSRRSGLEADGTPADPRLGAEGEPDPEYEDWLDEVVEPARRALLPSAAEDPGAGGRHSGTRITASLSTVAVLLLLVALGTVSTLAWQFRQGERQGRKEVEGLVSGLEEMSARQRSQLAAQARRAAAYRQEITELRSAAVRIASPAPPPPAAAPQSPAPLVNLAHTSFYPDQTRGAERELAVPAGADYLLLLFYVGDLNSTVGDREPCGEYRLEIARSGHRADAWEIAGLSLCPPRR